MNVLFRRNLGFIFDAVQMISCKTAKRESWIDSFVRSGSESKDLQTIETILENIDDVNPKERRHQSLCLTNFRNSFWLESIFTEGCTHHQQGP